jgi:hypothetical protein
VSVAYKIAHSVGDVARDRVSQSWISALVLCVPLPVVVGVLTTLTALTAPSARGRVTGLRCGGVLVR